MKHKPLPRAMYVLYGFLIAVLLCYAIITHEPDGLYWFLAGVFTMGIIMNLANDKYNNNENTNR